MIKISILYPNIKGPWFAFSYYTGTHIPISVKLLGSHPGFKGVSVEQGVGGPVPGTEPACVAICHFLFDSVENFLEVSCRTQKSFKATFEITQT